MASTETAAGPVIAGRREPAGTTHRIDVVNPADERVIAQLADSDQPVIDRAVHAAREALRAPEWATLAPGDRALLLRRLGDALASRAEDVASLSCAENGVTLAASRASVAKAVTSYRYYADLAAELAPERVRAGATGPTIVRTEPLGVAALITPWNGPQPLLAWKLAPTLAAGCTAVIKPAPETTLDAYLVMDAIEEAGFPPGVVNLVPGGRETGAALVAHPGVDKVAFTGSTAAGRAIGQVCGAALKPMTLELGGKSAAIVLDDVDPAAFAAVALGICMPNSGQVCRACTRVLVPAERERDVVDALAEVMRGAPVGDPRDPRTVVGPLVSARQRTRVERYIELGVQAGARNVCGGGRPPELEHGWYVSPTLFDSVDNQMQIAREEIFGPVLVVIPYRDEDEAIAIANDSEYGLGGYVHTGDLERGLDVARRIETGSVGVNHHAMALEAPFGGYKQSGVGREMGPEAITSYQQTKSIYCAEGAL